LRLGTDSAPVSARITINNKKHVRHNKKNSITWFGAGLKNNKDRFSVFGSNCDLLKILFQKLVVLYLVPGKNNNNNKFNYLPCGGVL
jgi:hypothetical protein